MSFLIGFGSLVSAAELSRKGSPAEVAVEVDRLVGVELKANEIQPAGLSTDEDFLRRVTLDISGTLPSARDVTLFGLNPDKAKRERAIERLLESDEYAAAWARYWRDVIFGRATNMRAGLVNQAFVDWMTESLSENKGWDLIATEMITASGDVRENGNSALIFAQEGVAEDVAGEVSRIFLGIQMQCANCHDHPWDRWKRADFHELAAFFPRISLRPVREENRIRSYEIASVNQSVNPQDRFRDLKENADRIFRFADRNRDGKLVKAEVQQSPLGRAFDLLLERGDTNKDGGLSLAELKAVEFPMPMQVGRGSTEHFMADLNNPSSPGEKVDPKFFVTGYSPKSGLADIERRELFSEYLTSSKNEWFSRAFVNRMWAEMTGEGFYMPIDDMGPDREAKFPEVLDLLAAQFTSNGYDVRWLIRTIALTETYQREVRSAVPGTEAVPFASATATRLRGDQLYSSLITVLGDNTAQGRGRGPQMGGGGGMYRGPRSPRDQFGELFGFDPSTPQSDITGNIPQALFMMNSPMLAGQINARGFTKLTGLLRRFPDNEDAINELYVMILSREPSDREMKIATGYLAEVDNREEAFEDLMWSLLNSSEFLSKR
ncbi:MAG: DUF1549 domain-containing protein [Rhodopirellula sp.]|nr:DUF1549 domain-containing protein [Rhodopirellula sp.]